MTKKTSIKLLEKNSSRYIDALYATLMMATDLQFFPEMYEIFGREAVIRFLDVFAGQKIVVPSAEAMAEKIRDVTVWCEMKKDASCRVRMMEEYHLSDGDVERIIRSVDKSMQELGIEVE